jgi:hypothetical protein
MNGFVVSTAELQERERWQAPAGPVRRGSEGHLRLFCLELLRTHDPYRPAAIAWPALDADAHARLLSLPIWDIAVETEGRAGMNVRTFAAWVAHPLLKEAVELDAFEESRHKQVLSKLVQFYGIPLQAERDYAVPRDAEFAFMATGYSECVDSFFAFGLFEVARTSGFFPERLVETFEPVMTEEGRHILFFVNWVAWRRRNISWWRRPWFELKILRVWAHILRERVGAARRVTGQTDSKDKNFTMTGTRHLGVDINFRQLAEICLREYERRLAPYDPRLLRPAFVPDLVRLALRITGERQAA